MRGGSVRGLPPARISTTRAVTSLPSCASASDRARFTSGAVWFMALLMLIICFSAWASIVVKCMPNSGPGPGPWSGASPCSPCSHWPSGSPCSCGASCLTRCSDEGKAVCSSVSSVQLSLSLSSAMVSCGCSSDSDFDWFGPATTTASTTIPPPPGTGAEGAAPEIPGSPPAAGRTASASAAPYSGGAGAGAAGTSAFSSIVIVGGGGGDAPVASSPCTAALYVRPAYKRSSTSCAAYSPLNAQAQ